MQTATNPQTGEKLVLQNGQWVPVGQASPVAPRGPVYGAPPKPDLPPAQTPTNAAIDEVQLQRGRIGIQADQRALERPEVANLPTGWQRPTPTAPAERIPGLPAAITDPQKDDAGGTDGQRANKAYFGRAVRALEVYDTLNMGPRSAVGEAVASLPGGTGLLKVLPDDIGDSPDRQRAEQAKRDFATLVLRSDSGANAPEAEVERLVSVYFPSAGETSPEVIENYRRARLEALNGIRLKAGLPPIDEAQPGGAPRATTPDGEVIYEGGAPQGIELSDGGPSIQDNPKLAGVNARVNEMLKSGAPGTEIAKFLQGVGVMDGEVAGRLRQLLDWRRKNPGYQGDYTVNLDDMEVPGGGFAGGLADAANSDLGAYAAAAGQVLTGNHLDNIISATGGNGELANVGMGLLREQNPYASLAGDITGGAGLYGAGRGALAAIGKSAAPATGAFAGRALAGDAAMGGYIGSGANGTEMFDGGQALLGALAGAGAGVMGRGAINTAGRALSPSGGSLAPAYAEGVKPTIGQRMGGVADRAEQAFASIPLVGGVQRSARNKAVDQWQKGAFNKALREIGTQLPEGVPVGTPAHAYMQKAFNKAYSEARTGLTFRQDPEFLDEFGAIVKEVGALPDQSQRIFQTIVGDGRNLMNARGGVLAGKDYQQIVSRIENKIRATRKNPSGDTELAEVLESLVNAMDKGARRHSAPEAIEKLDATDRGYVMAVLIEEASRKAGTEMGEFSGKQLEGAIRANSGRRSRKALRGEAPLQDYAAAGVRLGNNMADSGTPERLMTVGAPLAAAGGAGAAMVHPVALAPWVIDTLANLPGGKQAVNALLAPNRRALDPARRKLMERAHLAGILAAPAAQATVQE